MMKIFVVASAFILSLGSRADAFEIDCDLGDQQQLMLVFPISAEHSDGGFMILRDPATGELKQSSIPDHDIQIKTDESTQLVTLQITTLVARHVYLQYPNNPKAIFEARFSITSSLAQKIEKTIYCQRN